MPLTLEWLRTTGCAHITPLMDFAMVETACGLLEGLLCDDSGCPGPIEAKLLMFESYFQFAAIWAFGGALSSDKASDYRKQFSEWWRSEWSAPAAAPSH